jgi:very-short-patch-repair endonuclease
MEARPLTLKRAKSLRRTMTLPEVLLWQAIRPLRFPAARFRRQHPMGPYILDFFCPAANLAVELDGYSHDTGHQPEHDARRDEWLARQGIRTLRIPVEAVMESVDGVVSTIAAALPPQSLRDSSP